ncbi:MAG: N-acetyltransferase family protein [Phycisphaerales bacterium]|nr:N-acetyltransferase family protein [Phycisphaerales bacterium]
MRDDVPSMLAISNANAATSHANFAIEPETLEDWLSDWDLHHDRFPAHVGDRAGQIVGFARATPWKGRCAYEFAASTGIYVDPACHGEGLGSRMYDALLQGLRQAGFHTAIAGIALPNAASVALHERYGFEYVGTFRESGRKFGRWWDVAYYQCMLASQPSAQS